VSEPVLTIDDLTVALPAWSDRPLAVEGMSIAIDRNEILCVMGESGSGKSVMAKSILGLLPAPQVRVTGGRIEFEGHDLLQASETHLRGVRGGRISMIFQERRPSAARG
jgi:peptide/nickel transport system ATP-binding protein